MSIGKIKHGDSKLSFNPAARKSQPSAEVVFDSASGKEHVGEFFKDVLPGAGAGDFNAKNGSGGKTIIISAIFLFFILSNSGLHAAVVCTPQSALLCAAVDDVADVYINGIYIDTFGYVDVGDTGESPKCETLTATQLSALNSRGPTGNVIAVRDQNSNCCEMWATWSMQITCANGGYSYVDSDTGQGVDFTTDTNLCCLPTATPAGTIVSCDAGPTAGGYTWYNPLYNENGTWASASGITYYGHEYGQKIHSLQTGDLLVPLGYGGGGVYGNTGCQQIFFRQGFDLYVTPTPQPPDMTITKTSNKTVVGISGPNDTISFSFHICNSGGGLASMAGTIDQWTDTSSGWQYQGPKTTLYGITGPGGTYFGDIAEGVSNGPPAVPIQFLTGFPGVTCTGCPAVCYDFTWILASPDIVPCLTWYNSVTLTWPGGQASSSVPIDNFCPSKTFTPTSTPTPMPVMQVTKTANKSTAIVGDTITFSLCYENPGSATAPNVQLWDTIPPCITYVGSNPAVTSNSGGVVDWSLGNIGAGASGCMTWWGYVSCFPYNPFFIKRYYIAYDDRKIFIQACNYDYGIKQDQ
jgi:uncharacterized repeat protein (TIGR01451 family)